MVDQQVHNQALLWLGGCRLSGAGAWDLACFSVALTLLQTGQLGSKVGCMQLQQKWLGIISKKVVVAQESGEMVLSYTASNCRMSVTHHKCLLCLRDIL